MSDTNLNAHPVIKSEEMPDVNTLSSSSASHDDLPMNKQESEASDALSSFNNILLDQEAHDGLLGLKQLTEVSNEENEITSTSTATNDGLTYCSVCKRSNLQVNFHKNYTINTNNYKNYCGTFPQYADDIPKPKEGESHVVCSTCYNKQWRFANGKYDPHKDRAFNKREGLQLLKKENNTPNSTEKKSKRKSVSIDTEIPIPLESPKKKVKKSKKSQQQQQPVSPQPIIQPSSSVETKPVVESGLFLPILSSVDQQHKQSNNSSAIPIRTSFGIVSSAPATYKKEETNLLISYMKRINGILEDIYTTKIATHHCPESVEQLRDLVMERLTQKKGDLFTFDRACCNSVDRYNKPIKIEIDEFFFQDVKLNDNDSVLIYINDKQ